MAIEYRAGGRRATSAQEALAIARRAAAGQATLRIAQTGRNAPENRKLRALRYFRAVDNEIVMDEEAATEERNARRAIAFLDVDNFTPAQWQILHQAHARTAAARVAHSTPALVAAWKNVANIAKTLPKV